MMKKNIDFFTHLQEKLPLSLEIILFELDFCIYLNIAVGFKI